MKILIGLIIFFMIPSGGIANSIRELRIPLQSSAISLDPGGVQDSQSWLVSRQVNCQLVRSQGPSFILDAAESIKYITPLKIFLKISNKAKFHDGSPVTAEDVIASLNYIKESRNILGNFFTWIDKIEVLDKKTMVFYLKRQVPQFLKVLSSTNYTIFKKEFIEQAKQNKNLWKKPLGCGGYKVVEFNNNYIKLVPVSMGLPIIFDIIKGNQINAADLEKYDIVSINIIGDSSEIKNFNIIDMFDPSQFYIGLNSKSKFWINKYDRCKFLSQLNTENLLMSYGKTAIEANDLLPKGTLGYLGDNNFNDQIKNIAKKAKNFRRNNNLKPFCLSYLTVSIQEKYKNNYVNMLKKIYPDIYLNPIENVKKFGKDFISDNCDAIIFAWKSNYLDGYEYLTMFENNDANFSGVYDKNLVNMILRSQDIANVEERAKNYQEIIKKVEDLCIVRPILTVPPQKMESRGFLLIVLSQMVYHHPL